MGNVLEQLASQGQGAGAPRRRLHAATAPAVLDSVTAKMRQMSQDLLRMEIKDAMQTVANSVRVGACPRGCVLPFFPPGRDCALLFFLPGTGCVLPSCLAGTLLGAWRGFEGWALRVGMEGGGAA